jgi:ribosomal protein L20
VSRKFEEERKEIYRKNREIRERMEEYERTDARRQMGDMFKRWKWIGRIIIIIRDNNPADAKKLIDDVRRNLYVT